MDGLRWHFPGWAVDALLGAAVTAAVSVVISAGQGGGQQPVALAYLWAGGLGALMLARRRYPRVVLAVTALGLFAYYAIGYPAIGIAVPVAAALFSAAEAGRLTAAVATAAVVLGVSTLFRLLEGQDAGYVVGYELVSHVTLMGAAIALGDTLRGRRAQQAQQRELARLTAREYAREAERRLHADRLAIARDLHDSLGHTVSIISLHSDVAREAIDRDPAEAATGLTRIKDASSQMMRELRSTVALLRTPVESPVRPPGEHTVEPPGADLAPSMTAGASLADLESTFDTARAAGIAVDSSVDVPPGRLPPSVDATAYRIVQEAVTNVVRHSHATRMSAEIVVGAGALRLTITDNGSGSATGSGTGSAEDGQEPGGHGIAGMTERARSLGGTLTAGREGTGFAVRATLPLEVRS